ncbi:MAG: DUF2971 domain-containing protein [Candidatus Omnitrophica bacterium]|nr:DUF2971 domain-containing protein [Candidatus Omnitrophota bacterium]
MTTSPPRHVIRFYSNLQYALESIGFKEMTFLHPDKLNDPFDPPFYFVTDFNKDYQALINYVRQHHSRDLQLFNDCFPKESWEKFVPDIEKYFNECRNHGFIFSTCEITNEEHPKDSLYMWSHYGCGHRGVAIEFDTALLARPVLKSLGIHGTEPWVKIRYRSELPKITCESFFQTVKAVINDESLDRTALFKITELTLSSKSIVWKKEKEWRLILANYETKLKVLKLGLEDDTITALY